MKNKTGLTHKCRDIIRSKNGNMVAEYVFMTSVLVAFAFLTFSDLEDNATTALTDAGGQGAGEGYAAEEVKDVNPNNYSFTSKTNQNLNSDIISDPIALTGFGRTQARTSVGSFFRKNGGSFITHAEIFPGDTIEVLVKTGSRFGEDYAGTFFAGNQSADFIAQTKFQDLDPIVASYSNEGDVSGQPCHGMDLSETCISIAGDGHPNGFQISGFDGSIDILFSGPGNGTVSIDGGPFVFSSQATQGARIRYQIEGPSTFNSQFTTNFVIGSYQETIIVGTRAADGDPDPFSIPSRSLPADHTSSIDSTSVAVTGFEEGVITATNGKISVNGGAFTNETLISNNDSFIARISPAPCAVNKSMTVTIGNQGATFSATTAGCN